MDGVLAFKLIAALLVFLTGLAGGVLPLRVRHANPRYMSLMNVFSAGVFLAAALVHLLNDASEDLEDSSMSKYFNIAPVFCGCGFLLILIVEEAALYFQGRAVSPTADDESSRTARAMSTVLAERQTLAVLPAEFGSDAPLGYESMLTSPRRYTVDGRPSASVERLRQRLAPIEGSVDVEALGALGVPDSGSGSASLDAAADDEDRKRRSSFGDALEHMTSPQMTRADVRAPMSPVVKAPSHFHGEDDDGHDGHDHVADAVSGQTSSVVAALLLLALSFHSFIAGLGVGAQSDKAVGPLIAILSHKGLAAFSLGTSLVRCGASPARYRSYVLLFSSMTPSGIFVGILISTLMEGDVPAIFTALAAGTFLYVALMETLPTEMAGHHDKPAKILVLVVGYGLMSLLAIWA